MTASQRIREARATGALGSEINPDKAHAIDLIGEVAETPNRANVALRILRPIGSGGCEQVAYVVLSKREARALVDAVTDEIGDAVHVVFDVEQREQPVRSAPTSAPTRTSSITSSPTAASDAPRSTA